MKFIVDAQLPYGIKRLLCDKGFDAIHTNDLPDKERTTDNQIRTISVNEDRIVITKDSDFLDSYYVRSIPQKILLITTGNITNKDFYPLFTKNLHQVIELFKTCNFVEMDNIDIIGHE